MSRHPVRPMTWLDKIEKLRELFDGSSRVDHRIRTALANTSFVDLETISRAEVRDLFVLPNFGIGCLNRIREVLAAHGKRLRGDVQSTPEPTLKEQMAEILARLDRIERALNKLPVR